MNRYTLVWREEALEDLAKLWMASSDKPAFTQAVQQIEQRLRYDPYTHAYVAGRGTWGILCDPVRVLYQVSEPYKKVTVIHIGLSVHSGNGSP